MPAPAGDRGAAATGRVQAFLNAQRALTSFYAAEGRDMIATWADSPARGESTSPVLVPRAAAPMHDDLPPTAANSATSDKSGLPSSIQAVPLDNFGNVPSNRAVDIPIRSKKSGPSQLKPGPKATEPDESERSQRLAQRRDRRRDRRTATRAAEEVEGSDVGHDREDGGPKKKRHKVQSLEGKTKSKKTKVAPTLLLMQNFSAQNLGKSRLTIKPSASVGVFNKGKASGKLDTKRRPGKFKPDIVFSEYAFLNKARAIHSESSDISEDESDDSEACSAHSDMERANRRKAKSGTVPQTVGKPRKESRADRDRDEARGSPSPPPGPDRQSSPPWDVERQATSSPASRVVEITRSLPPKDKPLVVQVGQCAWSSKLNKLEQHTITPQASTSKSATTPSRKEGTHRPTVSSYFSAPQAKAMSPIPSLSLSPMRPSEIRYPTPNIDQPRAAPSYPNPPSPPTVLPFYNTLVHPTQGSEYMRAPDMTSPHPTPTSTPIPITHLAHFETHYANPTGTPDIREGWHFDTAGYHDFVLPIDPGDVQDTLASENVQDMELLDGDAWDGLEYGELMIGYDPALDGGGEVYEEVYGAHLELGYDDGFTHDGILGQHGDEEELAYAYENGEDVNIEELQDGYGAYMHPAEDDPGDQLGDIDYEEEPLHCADFDIDDEEPALLPSELDFTEDPSLGDDAPIEDEDTGPVPRLVRIVTEASLEEDLLKSIGNHWGVAHRLY